MTTDQELGARLRRLGEAVAPSDDFAARVAAAVASAPAPRPRRTWQIPMRAGVAAGLLLAVVALVLLSRNVLEGPAPGVKLAGGGKGDAGKKTDRAAPPAVAFALTDLAYINSKWGFIDRAGRVVIPAKYPRVGEFSEGLAAVQVGGTHFQGGQWGYVDAAGTEVIAPRFDWAYPFREGLAAIKVGKKFGFIDRAGKVVIPARFEDVGRFSAGLAAAREGGKWGFIGTDAKYRIEPRFGSVSDFSEGLAAACPVAEPGKEPKYGYIDAGGWYVIEPRFDFARAFREGRAAVRMGNRYGFIGRGGEMVIEPRYSYVLDFRDGRARVHDQKRIRVGDRTWRNVELSGYADAQGREFAPLQPDYDNGIVIDPKTGKLSARAIDLAGDEKDVTDVDLDRVPAQHGLHRVWTPQTTGGVTYHTYGFVDRSGKVVIPPTLEAVRDFSEGLAPFATGLDWKGVAAALKKQGRR